MGIFQPRTEDENESNEEEEKEKDERILLNLHIIKSIKKYDKIFCFVFFPKSGNYIISFENRLELYNKNHILINSYKNVAGGFFTQLCLIDENLLVYYKSENIDLVILSIENLKLKVIQKIEYIHDFPHRIIKGNSEQEFISQDIYGITKIWKKDNNSNMFNCLKIIRFSTDSSVFDRLSYKYTDLLIIDDILITK